MQPPVPANEAGRLRVLADYHILDRVPRVLTDAQGGELRILGRQVSYLLELRRVSHALAMALGGGS